MRFNLVLLVFAIVLISANAFSISIVDSFTGTDTSPPNTSNWFIPNDINNVDKPIILSNQAYFNKTSAFSGMKMTNGLSSNVYPINLFTLDYLTSRIQFNSQNGSGAFMIGIFSINTPYPWNVSRLDINNIFLVVYDGGIGLYGYVSGSQYNSQSFSNGDYMRIDINRLTNDATISDVNISFWKNDVVFESYRIDGIVAEQYYYLWVGEFDGIVNDYADNFTYLDLNFAGVSSNFTFDINNLNPEVGKNSVNWTFTNTTTYEDTLNTATYWLENDVNVATTENLMRTYTTVGNRIICLNTFARETGGTLDVNSLHCETINVKSLPQDVNFTWNPIIATKGTDTNFFGTATDDGTIVHWLWKANGIEFGLDEQDTNYSFPTGGDFNTCLIVQDDSDLNKTKCYNVSVYGSLNLQFYDENTGKGLKPIITIDGNNYAAYIDVNGSLVVPLNTFVSKDYSIKAVLENYGTRYFNFYLTLFTQIDFNAAMLDLNKGQTVNFKMVDENAVVLANDYVNLYISNTKLAGRIKTDSSGNCSFYLNENDENYFYTIKTITETLIFNPTTVSVLVPKDEINTTLELKPFNIYISGIGARQWTNLTTTQTIKVLQNTVEKYVFNIDRNSEYYARNYSIGIVGRTSTHSFQPFLVPQISGVLSWFYVFDLSGISFPNVLIKIKKNISGFGITDIESKITDGTGSANFSFVSLASYTIDFYYNDVFLFSEDITANSTSYYVYLSISGIEGSYIGKQPASSSLQVDFFPKGGIIVYPHNPVSIYEIIRNFEAGTIISSINIFVEQDGNVLYDSNFTSAGTYTQTFLRPQINAAKPLEIKITITTNIGVFVFKNFGYVLFTGEEPYNIWGLLSNAKEQSLGEFGALLIAFFISLFAVGGLANVVRDTSALGVVFCLVLSIFVAIGWVNVFIFGMICAFAGVLILLNRREVA